MEEAAKSVDKAIESISNRIVEQDFSCGYADVIEALAMLVNARALMETSKKCSLEKPIFTTE